MSDSHVTHGWANTLELLYDLANEIRETIDRFPKGYKTAARLIESLEPVADRDFRDEEHVCRLVGIPPPSGLERENREALGGRVVRPMRGSDARQKACMMVTRLSFPYRQRKPERILLKWCCQRFFPAYPSIHSTWRSRGMCG